MEGTVQLELRQKAVSALLKHIESERAKENGPSDLFGDDEAIQLIVSLKKNPSKHSLKPIKIPIPHSLFGENPEICLFVKDPQSEYKQKFEEQGIKISKVIGLAKLRANYKQFEAKRKLSSSYDLFLSDARILPLLPRLLGKSFFRKKKQPLPIDVTKDVSKGIAKARSSTFLFRSSGSCSTIRVGLTNFTEQQILENLDAILRALDQKLPGNWKNIQSLHIKASESIALPIYNSLPQAVKRIDAQIPSEEKEEEKEEKETKKQSKKEETKESKGSKGTKKPKNPPKKKSLDTPPEENQIQKKRKV